jgi:hypothetical protein
MRSFLWTGLDMRTARAKVAWDQVCLLKNEGGAWNDTIRAMKKQSNSDSDVKYVTV